MPSKTRYAGSGDVTLPLVEAAGVTMTSVREGLICSEMEDRRPDRF
jgi:hypothetical protein